MARTVPTAEWEPHELPRPLLHGTAVLHLPVSLFQTHSRSFEDNRFVYAVVSRRSGGVSIGVNLNPEKYCNFDCVYCQVDRTVRGGPVLRKDRFAAVGRRTGRNGRTGRHAAGCSRARGFRRRRPSIAGSTTLP